MADFTIDSFGEIMNKVIHECEIIMQVKIPENSDDAEVIDNVGAGAVMQFYILLQALTTIVTEMEKEFDKFGGVDMDKMLDEILKLVKRDVMAKRGEAE